MAKLLSVKNRILLGLAFLGDAFDEARLLGGLVPSNYKYLYGWVPPQYRRNNFYKAVSELLKTREITKEVRNGEVYLVMTGGGRKTLTSRFPMIKFARKRWDGLFTQAVFDVEEVDRRVRKFLRHQLLLWTFGKLQRSVYITPHNLAQDVAEFSKAHRLERVVKIFRAKLILEEDLKQLAERVWRISTLNERYQSLINEREEEKKGQEREGVVFNPKEKLLKVILSDPFLPREFLPSDWAGEKARRLVASFK